MFSLPVRSLGLSLAVLGWAAAAPSINKNVHQASTQCSTQADLYHFRPSQAGIQADQLIDTLPLPFDFNTSNSPIANASNSWWISAYVTGSDDHEYMILSHLLATHAYSIYRGSIYDITEPAFWQFTEASTDPNLLNNSQNGGLNVTTSDYFFGSTLPGNATKQLRTAVTRSDVQFDVTFNLSAPILFNTGIGGLFQFGIDQTGEWAMPAGITMGSLVRDNKTITFDTDRSYTWYDRQWNVGEASSFTWTWFQLHLKQNNQPADSQKFSIWRYDSDDVGSRQWVTAQTQDGVTSVQPLKTFEALGETWISPHTNSTYAQKWRVVFHDNTELIITSTLEDQELHSTSFATYEGFVTASGTTPSGDALEGYGLVEIQPPF